MQRLIDLEQKSPIGIETWMTWVGTAIMGVIGLTAFVYMNFVSESSFADHKRIEMQLRQDGTDRLEQRLDRLEDKLDRVIEHIMKR